MGRIAGELEAIAAGVAPPNVALVGNAILLCFVLAEIAKSGTQVVLYTGREITLEMLTAMTHFAQRILSSPAQNGTR